MTLKTCVMFDKGPKWTWYWKWDPKLRGYFLPIEIKGHRVKVATKKKLTTTWF